MIQSELLPRISGFIDGEWTGGPAGAAQAVINPATGETLAHVPNMGPAEANAAVDHAAAQLARRASARRRSEWLAAIDSALQAHRSELARIITLEQGKPLAQSVGEVDYAASFFRYYAGQVEHLDPRRVPEASRPGRWTVHQRPTGVTALITPWNFPLAMLAKKISAAIAAGCPVVAKPALQTPLTAIALWTLLGRIDSELAQPLNLVIGASGPIGQAWCSHPAVRLISFTGSTEVGRQLMAQAAAGLKRLALELGGNAPLIVLDDADLEVAATALISNKFRANGQTCVCANRIYAHARVVDDFAELVATRVRKLRVGNGLDEGVDVGPLIDRNGFDKVDRHVRQAIAAGAVRLVGGDPPRPQHDWGCFYPPTVLRGPIQRLPFGCEETFGPVIPIDSFESDDEVLLQANSVEHGLAAYLFTRDADRAARMVAALHFGHVGINTASGPTAEAPFGGFKQSGFGREGGSEGLFEFCEPQTVVQA